MAADSNPGLARSRLIDHFKRAYQIIVGLAIARACVKVLPHGFTGFPDLEFWLFATFFVTLVPIFHGGDRSLDIKYLDQQPKTGRARASYVWDVYMLLITAILFVKVADAIPDAGNKEPKDFYTWMMVMLVFDVAVLLIDGVKSHFLMPKVNPALASYVAWATLNFFLAIVCYVASTMSIASPNQVETIAAAVFAFAALRTGLDYYLGRNFLFP